MHSPTSQPATPPHLRKVDGGHNSGKDRRRIHEYYEFFDVIGKGGFGEVRKGRRKADGKMWVDELHPTREGGFISVNITSPQP